MPVVSVQVPDGGYGIGGRAVDVEKVKAALAARSTAQAAGT
jgi:hypothetical protein